MNAQTTADDESQMDNSDEQTILLGGGEKDYEDDFFLTGPKVSIASLKTQVGAATEHAQRNLRDSSIKSNLLSDTGTGTVKFKSWHNNFCLQLVILLVILFVIIFIFIIIIHNNFS